MGVNVGGNHFLLFCLYYKVQCTREPNRVRGKDKTDVEPLKFSAVDPAADPTK